MLLRALNVLHQVIGKICLEVALQALEDAPAVLSFHVVLQGRPHLQPQPAPGADESLATLVAGLSYTVLGLAEIILRLWVSGVIVNGRVISFSGCI